MAHPTDTQVGIFIWDINLLNWRKVTLNDLDELFQAGLRYTRRYSYDINDNVEYMGLAEPGTSSASIGWKIMKNSYSGKNIISIEFAEGKQDFLFKWDDRGSYSYS